jgi:hypothetical protein
MKEMLAYYLALKTSGAPLKNTEKMLSLRAFSSYTIGDDG